MMDEVVVLTGEDMLMFWWHLVKEHGLSLYSIHGDPFLMHDAAVRFGLCNILYKEG